MATSVALGLWGAGMGVMAPLQLAQNAALARQLGHFLPASVISYVGGVVWIAAVNTALQCSYRAQQQELPSKVHYARRRPEWWAWFGGFVGSTALVGSVAIAPLISFTAVATINSAGQLISSLLVDHYGFLGIQRRRLSLRRMLGALVVLVGCVGASLESSASTSVAAASAISAANWLLYERL